MRLGLMGGTFDPIHNGHLRVALCAAARGCDRVAFVPARRPPHKSRDDIADPFHRFAMAALATSGHETLSVSAFEVARDVPSYTIDTVRHYIAAGADVTLIMGGDSLAEIDTWRECEALLDLTRLFVYPRAPWTKEALERHLSDRVRRRWEAGSVVYLDGEVDSASSTDIRRLLKEGKPAAGLLPAPVAEYVVKHRLYVPGVEGEAD